MPLSEDLARICRDALEDPALVGVGELLRAEGVGASECHRLVSSVGDSAESHGPIARIKQLVRQHEPALAIDGHLERFLLLNSASLFFREIERIPVADSVKDLYRDEFLFLAKPPARDIGMFEVQQYRFAEMCKIVSGRRFPAGQLHWEVSGMSRRPLLRLPVSEIAKVFGFVCRKTGGFRPCFASHLNGRRKNRVSLLESLQNAAYLRIAKSMELQPKVRAYIATSWLYSAATEKASPHLGWLRSIFLENGGLIVDLGPDTVDCGALAGSEQRQLLWEKGQFQPRRAMVIWPRNEMLQWAEKYAKNENRCGHQVGTEAVPAMLPA